MAAYYNEIDPSAAAWLRELIKRGHIADGEVDTRSIEDVTPEDLNGFAQCHFFAGIGGWSLALRLAGWPDDRPVWTGSCPCQPFSAAGKGAGFADERHLWPHLHWLIEQCRPPVVFGEQVASKDGLAWLDLVQADLEGSGYAAAAVDLCAAGVGAPHIRQRLFWVADSELPGSARHRADSGSCAAPRGLRRGFSDCGGSGGVADGSSARLEERIGDGRVQRRALGAREGQTAVCGGDVSRLADSDDRGRHTDDARPGPTNGHWRSTDWLHCRDGKWRPVEPGTFPLAHGVPARVVRLRGYGNAIVVPQAQAFIEAFLDYELR